ncbi:hypothetical protein [Legionella saoudiensis]|uniref:hypothetical protein n=1 Tax=Legionella saoudiensis TaxID=1750561 RepID=UPI0007318A22|nr:hypothetical protein [Legionella saoudiensis]
MDKQWGHFIKLVMVFYVFFSGTAFCAVTSGQVMIINGLSNGVNVGSTATSILVQVSDHIGVCSTQQMLNFNGSLIVKWDAKKAHSTYQCTGISSVAVTPLRTIIGSTSTIVYDSTISTPVPANTATGPVHYFAPTVAVANLALLITGVGTPAATQAVSGTSWGIGAASAPVFDSTTGGLLTVGVPGGEGLAGVRGFR